MAEINELSMKEIKEIVEYYEDTFELENIDFSFLEGIVSILEHSNQKIQRVDLSREEEGMPNISANDIVNTIEEFYSKLSPEYYESAHNLGRRSRLKYSFEDNPLASKWEKINIDNSYRSIIIGVHEHIHSMTIPDGEYDSLYESWEDTNWKDDLGKAELSKLDMYFSETDSIYSEQLCNDFLEEKYKKKLKGMYPERFEPLKIMSQKDKELNFSGLEFYRAIIELGKVINNVSLTEENKAEYIKAFKVYDEYIASKIGTSIIGRDGYGNLNAFCPIIVFSLMHNVGFLFANYLHQNANMKDPELAKETLDKLIHINGLSSDFTREQVELLVDTGIPFTVVDGKLGMNQKCIDEINAAFDKTLENYQSRFAKPLETNKSKSDKSFNMEKITREALNNAIDIEETARVDSGEKEIQIENREQEEQE